MPQSYLMNDDEWINLVLNVSENFDQVTISRGFQYYKQGRVYELTMINPQLIESSVHGNDEYTVSMDLAFLSDSYCNCPVVGNCKHMFAVLLEYANEQGRPVNMLVNAQSLVSSRTTKLKSVHRNNTPFRAREAQAESLLKEKVTLIPTMSVTQWHELFEMCTDRLSVNIRSHQYAEQALQLIIQLNPKLTPDVEHIYMLNVHLFVLTKLSGKPTHPSDYYYRNADPTLSELLESVETYLANGGAIAANPDNQSLIQMTLSYIRDEMLMESYEKRYYLDVYCNYWHYWIVPYAQDDKVYTEELQELERSGKALGNRLSTFQSLIAQTRLNFYMSQDDIAWKLLVDAKKVTPIPSDMSIYYLYYLAHHEQWNRLLSWLIAIPPLFQSYRSDYLDKYMVFWELVNTHIPDAENSMWDTLMKLLPYSRPIYKEKLIEHRRWKQWMDYQLSSGSDPSEFRVSELQPIEKNAPELLLPFYHQAVERYILIKNREGYKAAVKLLKRLAKLYRRLKQEDRWEQFLANFIQRHSRLRALQEELRKGKLVQ